MGEAELTLHSQNVAHHENKWFFLPSRVFFPNKIKASHQQPHAKLYHGKRHFVTTCAAQRELVIDSKIFCFNWLQTDSGWKGVNLHMSSQQVCSTTHDSYFCYSQRNYRHMLFVHSVSTRARMLQGHVLYLVKCTCNSQNRFAHSSAEHKLM